MPDDDDTHTVEIYLDGELALDPFEVDMHDVSGGKIRVAIEGVGTQVVEAYVDNKQVLRKAVTFE